MATFLIIYEFNYYYLRSYCFPFVKQIEKGFKFMLKFLVVTLMRLLLLDLNYLIIKPFLNS